MAAGTDGLIEFTLIGGKKVTLSVSHIVAIEALTNKELQSANFRKYGTSSKRYTNINKVRMSTGRTYIIVATTDGAATVDKIVSDTKATKSTVTLSGGRF